MQQEEPFYKTSILLSRLDIDLGKLKIIEYYLHIGLGIWELSSDIQDVYFSIDSTRGKYLDNILKGMDDGNFFIDHETTPKEIQTEVMDLVDAMTEVMRKQTFHEGTKQIFTLCVPDTLIIETLITCKPNVSSSISPWWGQDLRSTLRTYYPDSSL